MNSTKLLDVRIDQVSMDQAVDLVLKWAKEDKKRYVVTPNIEFLMAASGDREFREILNNSDLSIPDSARFSWAKSELEESNFVARLAKWPMFLFSSVGKRYFETVAGTDLMEELIKQSKEKGVTIGFLGGKNGVAERLRERLRSKYPGLMITFADSNIEVDRNGNIVAASLSSRTEGERSQDLKTKSGDFSSTTRNDKEGALNNKTTITDYRLPSTDILFVAFGQVKQEKWIKKNLNSQPVKVMIGVGGAFDYLSGDVSRAPKWVRRLGFEWLYRVILQPWRIKRFVNLVKFIFIVLLGSRKS